MKKLYIIGSDDGPFKIGISQTPEKRLKQLQTGNSNILKIQYQEEISFDNPFEFEKILHFNLKFKKLKGEWFNETLNNILLEIDYAKIRYSDETNPLSKLKQSIIKS